MQKKELVEKVSELSIEFDDIVYEYETLNKRLKKLTQRLTDELPTEADEIDDDDVKEE